MMNEIIDKLNKCAEAYYNTGKPLISDAEYDILMDELRTMEEETGIIMANSPTQNVGAPVLDVLEKIKINPPMLSLEKCHTIQEIKDFNAVNKNLIAMVKCDGLSVRLVYEDGKLISANTRGDGEIGAVITEHVKQFINVPLVITKKEKYVIDGEAVIKLQDFNSNEFANQRNAAAGALNLLDTKEVKRRRLSFIAWDVISGSVHNLLSDKLLEASNLGFEVVDSAYGVSEPKQEFIDILLANAKNNGIPSDGIVWKFDDSNYCANLGRTGHHYKCGIAWKPEHVVAESILRDIEWSMGRTGMLTPVGIFDEVDLLGSKVSRASLHNISIMQEILGTPYIGQKITLTKANLIIPQILSGEKSDNAEQVIDIPDICPFCGQPLIQKQDNKSVFLTCVNDICPSKIVNSIDHYAGKSGLDIKGLSIATLEFLAYKGWLNNIVDLYKLEDNSAAWAACDGWGYKSVEKILKSIKDNSTDVEDWKFLSALGIPLVGKRMSKELMKTFDTFEWFLHEVEIGFNFEVLDGVGPEIASAIKNFNYDTARELIKNGYVTFKHEDAQVTKASDKCNGLTFVITGDLVTGQWANRNDLAATIESMGGKVSGSVSSKTSYLINNDSTSTSGKNKKAKELNIPIITEQEFIDKFL